MGELKIQNRNTKLVTLYRQQILHAQNFSVFLVQECKIVRENYLDSLFVERERKYLHFCNSFQSSMTEVSVPSPPDVSMLLQECEVRFVSVYAFPPVVPFDVAWISGREFLVLLLLRDEPSAFLLDRGLDCLAIPSESKGNDEDNSIRLLWLLSPSSFLLGLGDNSPAKPVSLFLAI